MFLTIEHVPRITDFCRCRYVLGCGLSLVRLCDSDFGITPVDDVTIWISCTAFCFHIAHISFASSWYLFCLSVIVLLFYIIIIIIIISSIIVSCHRPFFPGTSLEPAVIPTAHASSFTLQYFPYYV